MDIASDFYKPPISDLLNRNNTRLLHEQAVFHISAGASIILHCIVMYCIVLYCIVLYCIVLYCIVLYYKYVHSLLLTFFFVLIAWCCLNTAITGLIRMESLLS